MNILFDSCGMDCSAFMVYNLLGSLSLPKSTLLGSCCSSKEVLTKLWFSWLKVVTPNNFMHV